MPRPDITDESRNAATYVALAGLVGCGLGLLGLAALVIPDILWMLVVGAVLAMVGVLQYVVWGWRLDAYRVPDDEVEPAE